MALVLGSIYVPFSNSFSYHFVQRIPTTNVNVKLTFVVAKSLPIFYD